MRGRSKSGKLVIVRTIIATVLDVRRELHATKLGALEPYFLGLILLSVILYLIHVVSPLAPFVYSLF